MRRYTDPSGKPQLWLDASEIDEAMEAATRVAGVSLTTAAPVVDLEHLLEQALGVHLDLYAPLDPHVLGVTAFRRGEAPLVEINQDLSGAFDDGNVTATARLRSTLAHEAAHVVLHAQLFDLSGQQGDLFGEAELPAAEPQRCLKREVAFSFAQRDPREVQANMGMAALLMPSRLFIDCARIFAAGFGLGDDAWVPASAPARHVAVSLADRFQVSRQAVEIRLQTLGFYAQPGQPHLA